MPKSELENMMEKFHNHVTKELKSIDNLLEKGQISKARDRIYYLRQIFNLETN